jgi:flagellar biosynthesis protein FlhB
LSSRTLPPTPRRLARARREGDHPISTVLTRLSGAICAAALLPFVAGSLVRETRELLGAALRADATASLAELPSRVIWRVLPFLGAIAALVLALGASQTGATLSSAPLAWKWQRLDPFGAFGRRDGLSRFWAGAAVALSLGLFATLATLLAMDVGAELAASVGDLDRTVLLAAEVGQRLLWWAVLIGLGLAVVDALVQRRAWLQRQRMTREERDREQRETEGDPALRHERRATHRSLLDSAQLSRLPAAALIVFDWPLLAVALHYDPERDTAPVVLLQVVGPAVGTARAAAEFYQVSIQDDPALARRLGRLALDTPIPSSLFAAVATALEPWARAQASRGRAQP